MAEWYNVLKEKMAVDRSIAYALQKVGFSFVTLKHEHMMCMKYIYERKTYFCGHQLVLANLCYEVLPFVFDDKLGRNDSNVIVVSPLASLMLDQVRSQE